MREWLQTPVRIARALERIADALEGLAGAYSAIGYSLDGQPLQGYTMPRGRG